MAKPKITLYFDIISPFAYMAYYLTRTAPVFQQCDITYVPFLLGGVMKATDNRPPLEIKNKKDWINLERQRWARLFAIPIADTPPDGFPLRTLGIQRALTALTISSPEKLTAAIDACYKAFWGESNVSRIEDNKNLLVLLGECLGEGVAKEVMEKSTSDQVKKLLNQRSEQAVAEGAFGAPYWIATNAQGEKEAFWGFDHMGQVLCFLGLETPRPTGGWQAML